MRPRIKPETLAQERRDIMLFSLDALEKLPARDGAYTLVSTLFNEYKKWRRESDKPATQLTIDGFGRLFPKTWGVRKVINRGGVAARAVMNVGISK